MDWISPIVKHEGLPRSSQFRSSKILFELAKLIEIVHR